MGGMSIAERSGKWSFSLLNGLHFLVWIICLCIFSSHVLATEAPSGLVYQGRIIKPDNSPLESNSVTFDLAIYSSDGSCLLYEETHNVDMTGSAGSFVLTIGSGTSIGPSYTVKEVFSNTGSFTGGGSCSYSPSSGDTRQIMVSFNDGSGAVALQNQVVRSVPYALYASRLEGLGRNDFLQINTGSSNLTQGNANSLFQTSTYNELIALAGGTSTQFAKASDLPVSSGVLNLSGAGQGVTVANTPTGGTYAVNKNYSDAYIGGKAIDSTDLASLGNGQSIMWDTTANSGLGGWIKYTPASAANTVINGGQTGAVSLGTTDANSLTFKTGNTSRVTVDSSGNVGIGSSPAADLLALRSPNTVLSLDSTASNQTPTIKFSDSGSGKWLMQNRGNNTSPADSLIFYRNGVVNSTYATLTLNQNGYVGIGTDNPQTELDVNGSVAMHGYSLDMSLATTGYSGANSLDISQVHGNSASENHGINLQITDNTSLTGGAGLIQGNLTGTKAGSGRHFLMDLQTDGSSKLYVASSGKTGIGTTSPAAPLDVAGDVKIGNSNAGCSSTNKGSIRYTASNTLEVCDSSSWKVIQAGTCSDPIPDVFTFTNEANATTSTLYTSDIIQVTGIDCTVPVTISGNGSPQYQICSDGSCSSAVQGWTTSPSSISVGQYIQARLTSDTIGGSTFQATIIVGSGATVWNVTTTGSCASSPAIGTVCADGTIYAGLSPDGNVPMYTTRCDAGESWSGSACTGSRLYLSWNNGTNNLISTYVASWITGKSNSAALHALSDAASPYAAAAYCETLNLNGNTDWYLPAMNELQVLYANRSVIGHFDNDNYLNSSEEDGGSAYNFGFNDGGIHTDWKYQGKLVRCVRR